MTVGTKTDQIVGRRQELAALGEFLDAVPAGASALLLEGDAGIGKTALWQEGARLARDQGMRVLTARASHSELRTAFATVTDLFAPVLDETLPRLVPVQRRALEVAFLIREPDGPPPEGRLLAAALLSIVRILVEDRPLLVAVDDVQWVDASSAEILRFVLRRLEAEPVGVLATVRGRPVEAPFELDRAFAEFRRHPVTALSVGAIHRLLWGRLSLNLPRPVLVRVHETTGGNPFFALEVGRALANGTIRADGVHVLLPESLRALVAERLSALPAQARETLTAVAALGAPSVTLLGPLAPTTVDDIELACRRRVLELDGDRIRFTHPLLAPVCYEEMPLHRRRRLHRRLADLDVDPEERARHLAVAAPGPDEEIAAALDEAAAHARRRGAAQAAAELAERAIALTPTDAADAVGRRRMSAAWDCFYAGDGKKATALLEEAVGSAKPGPIRADALCALAVVVAATDGKRAAADLYERALAEPGLELGQRAHVLCELACLAAVRCENEASTRLAEAGLALAEQLGDPDVLVVSLVTVAEITFWRAGRIRRDLLERAMTIERAAGEHAPGRRPHEDLARSRRRPADDPRLATRPVRPSRRSARPLASADRRGVRARRSRRRPVPLLPRQDGGGEWRLGRGRATVRRGHGGRPRDGARDDRAAVRDGARGDRSPPGRDRAGATGDPRTGAGRREGQLLRRDPPSGPRPCAARALVRRCRGELAPGRAALRGARGAGRLPRPPGRLGRDRGPDRSRRSRRGGRLLTLLDDHASEADTALRPLAHRCRGASPGLARAITRARSRRSKRRPRIRSRRRA